MAAAQIQSAALPARPRPFGARTTVMGLALLAGLLAGAYLELWPGRLMPAPGAGELASEVFGAAFSPATNYESTDLPDDMAPLLIRVLMSVLRTVVYAVGGMSLVVVFGLGLGFLSSTAWWADESAGATGPVRRLLRRTVRPAVYGTARVTIAVMRSTHELLWAILFLSAMGLTPIAAVIALAIPHTGILAKIFAEMIDEAPRDSANHLRASGASSMQQYIFGLLPRAKNDLLAYSFYRFECIVRGSAVLGFFGVETVGKYIRDAYANTHYHEMWTYIYALLVVVIVLDFWSGIIRRRLA